MSIEPWKKTGTGKRKKKQKKLYNGMSKFARRLNVVGTQKTGYWWNGLPVHVECLMVQITENPETNTYWALPFIGQFRQALKITLAGHPPFFIDNEDGTGLIKITHGKGAQNLFHRGIVNPIEHYIVFEGYWNQFSLEKYNEIERQISKYIKENRPDDFERAEQVRLNGLEKIQKMTGIGDVLP